MGWTTKSLLAGLAGGIIMYLLFPYWKLALITAVAVFLIALAYNPQRVFILAFSKITFLLVLFNQPYFEFKGNVLGNAYKIGNTQFSAPENIMLIFLALVALILHFLFNKKLKGSLIEVNRGSIKIGQVSGNSKVEVNQQIKNKTKN